MNLPCACETPSNDGTVPRQADSEGQPATSRQTRQNKKDFPRYERLFGRAVEVFDMGNMGHTAPIFNPDKYTELYEQTLKNGVPAGSK